MSLGYGWLLRGTYGMMALGALLLGLRYGEPVVARDVASAGVALASAGALLLSILRRSAGVAGNASECEARASGSPP